MTKLAGFAVEFLGVNSPSFFPGYGVGPSLDFKYSAYGIGDTEKEALDDCLEMMAQSSDIDLDEETEKRICAAYGDCDEETTVADVLDWSEEEQEEVDDSGEGCYFHIGIKWNEEGN